MQPRRVVLLDRDGTLIVLKRYLSEPREVELIDGAAAGLRRLAGLGLGLVIVSNQSGIARGLLDEGKLAEVHQRLTADLAAEGVRLDGIFHCPHHPEDGCACRKPGRGMVDRAAAVLDFDPSRCFVVGDAPSDLALGRAIGATAILVRTGRGVETLASGAAYDHVVDDLLAAAELIEGLLDTGRRRGLS